MKETFYFSHDYNARNDEKIKRMIRKHGLLGYGIYWAIIEDLYNNANELRFDCDQIAFDMRVDEVIVKSILMDFELFETNISYFSSNSVGERLQQRLDKSAKARDSANKRWGDKNANAKQSQSEGNAIKERKGKENKGKESKKEQESSDDDCDESSYNNKTRRLEEGFIKFWNIYPKKVNKKKAEQRFNLLNLGDLDNLFIGLDLYIKKWKTEETKKTFIPGPEVWIGNEKRCDEIICEGSPHGRTPIENKAAKAKKKIEDDEASKQSAKINAEKQKILDYWNSLSAKDQEDVRKQAKENAMKRHKKDKEFMSSPFAKPMIQAEVGILLKSKLG